MVRNVHSISMDTKEPFCLGADPKIAVVVEHQVPISKLTSIERGGHEWFDSTFLQLSKSAWPSPNMPTHRDPSGPRAKLKTSSSHVGYFSERRHASGQAAACPPSQKPPLPSARREWMGEIGTPSAFPKHLTAVSNMAKGRVRVRRRSTHKEPSGVLADV